MGLLSRIKSGSLSPVNGWNLAKFLVFFGVFWNVQRWLILSTEWHTLTSLLLGWYKQGGNLRMWARQVSELGSFIPATPTIPTCAATFRLWLRRSQGVQFGGPADRRERRQAVAAGLEDGGSCRDGGRVSSCYPGGAWCHGFFRGFWMTQDGENKRMTLGDCRWWYYFVCWRMF